MNFDLFSKNDEKNKTRATFLRDTFKKKPADEVKTELVETIGQTLSKHGVYHVPLEWYCQSVKLDINIVKKQQGNMHVDVDL